MKKRPSIIAIPKNIKKALKELNIPLKQKLKI